MIYWIAILYIIGYVIAYYIIRKYRESQTKKPAMWGNVLIRIALCTLWPVMLLIIPYLPVVIAIGYTELIKMTVETDAEINENLNKPPKWL